MLGFDGGWPDCDLDFISFNHFSSIADVCDCSRLVNTRIKYANSQEIRLLFK